MKYFSKSYIIIVVGFLCAEIILFLGGETDMDTAGWISITVALIAVAGGVWGQIIQFKKDAQRIDDVKKTTGEVKADTSGMKPQINTIEELSKQISEDIVRNILPQMSNVGKIGENVGKLVEGYNIEKEVKNRVSSSLNSPDYLVGSIRLLYEVNAGCNQQIQQLTNERYILQNENEELKEEVARLRKENEQLRKENLELDYGVYQQTERDFGNRGR